MRRPASSITASDGNTLCSSSSTLPETAVTGAICLQLFDHGPIANVPGVENVIDASEVSPDGRIEQAVGIGNDADQNGSPLVHGAATG